MAYTRPHRKVRLFVWCGLPSNLAPDA
jgi:hypothetical protein